MKDLWIRCPFHEGDTTPSLSILLQDRGSLKAGFSHCFGCGWSGNYKQVEQKLGYMLDIPAEIRQKSTIGDDSVNNTRVSLNTVIERFNARDTVKNELPFKFSIYLKSRGIGEVVQRFNRVYQNTSLHMPFFDPFGQFMGSIERSVNDTKFYRVNGNLHYPIGIEEIRLEDFVYVTEGQIDKMSLEECGFKSVALGTVSNYRLLRFLKNFNICFAFDNDSAGKKAIEIAFAYITRFRYPNLYVLNLPVGFKDINESLMAMGKESFTDWIRKNTVKL